MSSNRTPTFGEWLRGMRNALGLAQEELALRAGMSASMLRKLEAGERRPSGQIASLLADLLDIPADERQAFITFSRIEQPGFSPLAGPDGDDPPSTPPWRDAHLRQASIPFVLGTMVGRDEDERRVREHILDSKVRLLTLVGPPGIGKTRLALQVASGLADEFEDGVFFVELASVVDPLMLIPAVARMVEIKDTGEHPVEAALLNYLRSRKILLVLDNFEQLLDASLQLVHLMESCPWLKVLITSREALHVRGERRLPVLPLRLPDPALNSESARSKEGWIESLETVASIQLFVEGARSVLPDFALTEENALDVAEVCTRLEGLPLSIELAAARVGHLSLSEMRSGLASRLKLLTGGARDLPLRHRTLRSAIEWSYSLLDETEQALFRRLGVFVSGFTVEGLAAVCDSMSDKARLGGAGLVYAADLADRLGSLVEKNLVRKEERREGRPGSRAGVRFATLETLREFALDRLEACGEIDSVRGKHVDYYLELAERAENELEGAHQVAWLRGLEEEHDNLRAGFEWAAERGAWETGLRLAGALWRFWEIRDYGKEGLQRLESWVAIARRIGLSQRSDTMAYYAKALIGLGTLDFKLNGIEPALTLIQESAEIARKLDDKLLLALSLRSLAPVYRYTDLALARACLEESLAIYREAGSKAGVASALYFLGIVALDEEEMDRAQLLLEESRDLWRSVGETVYLSGTLLWLGEVARSREDYRAAREAYEEALSLHRIAGINPVYLMINLGHVAHSQQDYARSEALFTQSLVSSFKSEDNHGTLACLAGLAAVASGQEQLQRAGKLFGATDALISALGVRLDVADRLAYERHLAQSQVRFEQVEWEAAWADGQRMSLEEAVAFAISLPTLQALLG